LANVKNSSPFDPELLTPEQLLSVRADAKKRHRRAPGSLRPRVIQPKDPDLLAGPQSRDPRFAELDRLIDAEKKSGRFDEDAEEENPKTQAAGAAA
jgi:hypothetical protein